MSSMCCEEAMQGADQLSSGSHQMLYTMGFRNRGTGANRG